MQQLFTLAAMFASLWMPAQFARADLYGFVDENGRAHVSTQKLDARYQLFKRGNAPGAHERAKKLTITAELAVPDIPATQIRRYKQDIAKVAKKYALEPALIHAVVSAESRYDPEAISYRGAVGLMQLMPDTAERYKVDNPFDPIQNLHGGARYLRYLIRLFDGDLELALAAYNAGEGAVLKSGGKIPAYTETVRYVPKVLAYYKKYQQKI